jgi:hypothetical protein
MIGSMTATTSSSSPRLKGVLALLQPLYPDDQFLSVYNYDRYILAEAQRMLPNNKRRKKKRQLQLQDGDTTSLSSFSDLVAQHKFACFFFVQEPFTSLTISLRRRLATEYQESMTIFVVSLNSNFSSSSLDEQSSKSTTTQDDVSDYALFCKGTGFARLSPPSLVLTSLLNVVQIPTLAVLDTTTGRLLPEDAGLAMEWNSSAQVLEAWNMGQSGLTMSQKVLAVASLQSNCTIQ